MKKNIVLSALLTGTALIVTNSHADLGVAEKQVMDVAIKHAEQVAKGHLPALENRLQNEIKKTDNEIARLRGQIKTVPWGQKVKLKVREAYLIAKKGFLSDSLTEIKKQLGVK